MESGRLAGFRGRGSCLHLENWQCGLLADSCTSVFRLHFDLKEVETMTEKSAFDKTLGELQALVMVSNCLEREFIHRQLATGRPLHLNI